MGESYAAAGVDIDAGEEAVRRIGPAVRSTFTESVLTDVGGFGAPFALDTARFTRPVLVSSTDGVGTKLLVAEATAPPAPDAAPAPTAVPDGERSTGLIVAVVGAAALAMAGMALLMRNGRRGRGDRAAPTDVTDRDD